MFCNNGLFKICSRLLFSIFKTFSCCAEDAARVCVRVQALRCAVNAYDNNYGLPLMEPRFMAAWKLNPLSSSSKQPLLLLYTHTFGRWGDFLHIHLLPPLSQSKFSCLRNRKYARAEDEDTPRAAAERSRKSHPSSRAATTTTSTLSVWSQAHDFNYTRRRRQD